MSFHMVNVTVAPKIYSLRLNKNDEILDKIPKRGKPGIEKNRQNLSNFCSISASFYFFCMKGFSGENTLFRLSNALLTMFLRRLENFVSAVECWGHPK